MLNKAQKDQLCDATKLKNDMKLVTKKEKKKTGRLLISHRYNRLSLLSSDPGEIQQELVV